MNKFGRIAVALVAVFVLSFGSFAGANPLNVVEAAKVSETIGSTSTGSDWKSGQTGFTAGCALSEWLGWFECHDSQVPW
ncbi:hypothetical protein [Halobacillus sp. Marseille-Q1614]|uniref:hypothetical protein n=1 Tax=Halobacillus sp. Marseille-Q1614 TaxID=2709134 RepID=UPI001570D0BE|nr:hypothetical protein [Halobacillus sp. Marseille-Q1614]